MIVKKLPLVVELLGIGFEEVRDGHPDKCRYVTRREQLGIRREEYSRGSKSGLELVVIEHARNGTPWVIYRDGKTQSTTHGEEEIRSVLGLPYSPSQS